MMYSTPITLRLSTWLAGAALCGCLTLRAQLTDTTPPKLDALAFSLTKVDVTDSDQTVSVTMTVSDNLSGIDSPPRGSFGLVAPNGQYLWFGYELFTLQTGDDLAGTWAGTITIPQLAAPGIWRVNYFNLMDRAGNNLHIDGSQVSGLPTLEVISVNDQRPPELLAFNVPSVVVDTSADNRSVQIELRVRDDVSGFGPSLRSWFCDGSVRGIMAMPPAGSAFQYAYCFSRFDGSPLDGRWWASFYFPRYSASGEWKLYVNLKDNAGNLLWLDADALKNLNFPNKINVYSDNPDTTPPSVTKITLPTLTIDTSDRDVLVNTSVDVSDDISGIQYVVFILQSPSGGQRRSFYCPVSDAAIGPRTITGSCTFQRFSEGGTWKLTDVYAYDRAGNQSYLANATLGSLTAELNVVQATLVSDDTVGLAGGTVIDKSFDGAKLIVPANVLIAKTDVAIDVLQSPFSLPLPTGFQSTESYYVNIHLEPTPSFPLASPGLTVVLPLRATMTPSTTLDLYRIDPVSGQLTPAINVDGEPVQGTVDPGGLTATFKGVSRLSTVVALLRDAYIQEFTACATPNLLWSPDHKLVPVVIATTVKDSQDSPITLSVDQITSTEPQAKDKQGQVIPDWQIVRIDQATGQIFLQLRAERAGNVKDRVYSIYLTAQNPYGSSKSAVVTVVVPHDQGQK